MNATKQNYCTPLGVCSCQNFEEELSCGHRTQAITNGLCIYRAWFMDKCMSPWALTAARAQAAQTNARPDQTDPGESPNEEAQS